MNTATAFGKNSPFFITGRDLERHFDAQEALLEFTRLFRDESNDRAMVIVGAAFLDAQLEHVLLTFLVDDPKEVDRFLQYPQPLGANSARISALYCLGLIGPLVRDDLRLVGKIRNRFAHDMQASFATPEISSWTAALRLHRETYMTPPSGASARDLFNVGVNRLVGYLDGLVSIARGEKRRSSSL